MPQPVVPVPSNIPVTWSMATIPRETPFGIMSEWVRQCSFGGSTYNLMSTDRHADGTVEAIDLDDGSVVYLLV